MKQSRELAGASRRAWYALTVLLLAFFFNYVDRSILSILVLPIQHDLGMSDTAMGLLQGVAFALFYGVFSLPISRLADRGNRRNLLLGGITMWCAATAGCGFVQTAHQLLVARLLVAIGEAVLMPCAVSMLADLFPRQKQGRAFGIFAMGAYLGGAGASLGGGMLLQRLSAPTRPAPWGQLAPWRAVFLIVGFVGLIVVPLLFAVREPERRLNDDREAESISSVREVYLELRRKWRAVGPVVLGYAFIAMTGQTLQLWLPTLFIRVHGWNIREVGIVLGTTALLAGPAGSLTGGLLADKMVRQARFDSKVTLGAGGAFVSIFAGLLLTLRSDHLAVFGLALFYFFFGLSYGLSQPSIVDLMPNRMRAQTISLYGLLNNLLGVALGPVIVGVLNDRVFHDATKIGVSLRIVVPASFCVATILLWSGRRAVRAVLAPVGMLAPE